ncbi:dipeptide ABC transporter ATP-binding protein [Ruania alba]|uniref:Peptide/nickel transport system ATP-binding protein n=1 Tax=Ruania alba TaxID=648782 RepID=A0A1H5MRF2_9MICO|nr:ABC transporter ATP-binding protein [Ruania alba]SEE91813.1 peptide/nickel transport system ATP-binding protein [Ruania alba]
MSTRAEHAGAAAPVAGVALDVTGLNVGFGMPDGTTTWVVHDLDVTVPEHGSLAIVGESGSGKSVSMRGILGLLPGNATVTGRAVLRTPAANGLELIGAPEGAVRRIRGRDVGMVFQNAMEALNPSIPLERQLTEHLIWHGLCGRQEATRRAVQALGDVGIPEPERRLRMYPFQLSGGMRQRAMIAMATITRPQLVIADEPTTALDVTVQKQILDLLVELRERGMALVMITHDLGVARYVCDSAVVMREGLVLERAPIAELIETPQHEYSQSLVDAALDVGDGPAPIQVIDPARPPDQVNGPSGSRDPVEEAGAPVLQVRDLRKVFEGRAGDVLAVDGVSFDLRPGRTLGVVGESGSGKSTLARLILRLVEPTAGEVQLDGEDLLALSGSALRRRRRGMQMVFQSPYGSLLPTYTAAENIAEPLRINKIGTRGERRERALELLERVQLAPQFADVYPRQLSGGQQQRVAIARALALEPALLVGDEPTSALDASVQAQVLDLLRRLQDDLGFAMLLITHNLAVVERLADDVMVMRSGEVVEKVPTAQLFSAPEHDYTKTLLDAVLPVRNGAGAMPR